MASNSITSTSSANLNIKTETAAQLFARLETRPSLDGIIPSLLSSVSPTDVVEIYGESGAGKTEFIYNLISKCIFPSNFKGTSLEGLDADVLFIDNNYTFNILRLITLLESKLKKAFKGKTSFKVGEVEDFITGCLTHIHVIQCQSFDDFTITLLAIEDKLGTNARIACIMIDSISSFYWVDRWIANDVFYRLDQQHKRVVGILKRLMKDYALPVFVTKQKLFQSTDNEFMGRDWQKFVTHRIMLSLVKVEDKKTILSLDYCFKAEKKVMNCIVTEGGMEFIE